MKKTKLLSVIIIIMLIILNIICMLLCENKLFISLLLIFIDIYLLLMLKMKKNIIMLCYLTSFFIFLMGRPIAKELFGSYAYSKINLTKETISYMYICLIVSIISLFVGYVLYNMILYNKKKKEKEDPIKETLNSTLRNVAKIFSIITLLLTVLENLIKTSYMLSVGYTESFAIESKYTLPFGLHILVEVAPVASCLFLATMPSKKETRIPIILFIISGFVLAIGGQRSSIVYSLLFIFVYLMLRNENENSKAWISNKKLLLILVFLPIFIYLLQQMTYWRGGSLNSNINNYFLNFLYGVGGSSDLIGIVHQNGNEILKSDILYSFGHVWRNIHNIISLILDNWIFIKSQTLDMVNYGHSLSSAITYYYYPQRFLNGYGLGGCYIAELLHDFSLFGVIFGNFIVGLLISTFKKIENGKTFKNFIGLFLIMFLFRLPRDSFDFFIIEFIGIKNILFFVFLIVLSNELYKRKLRKNKIENLNSN